MGSSPSTPSTGVGPTQHLSVKEPSKQRNTSSNDMRTRAGSTSSTRMNITGPTDVMISYSHSNKDIMMLVKDALEKHGYTVWVDWAGLTAGVDFLGKIGQAIINSKAVVAILSERAVKSKYCQDELALAYISSKPVIPVAVTSKDVLFGLMELGSRLQLENVDWIELINEKTRDNDVINLVQMLKDEIGDPNEIKPEKPKEPEPPKLMRERSRVGNRKHQVSDENVFWKKHFKRETSVAWNTFCKVFRTQYSKQLSRICSDEEDYKWLLDILKRELNVEQDIITYNNYKEFCTEDGVERAFWPCVRDQAAENLAMREVFEVNSSVRVDAIENLSKFRSAQVVELLIDLLKDEDTDIVTVAAVSLARTGSNENQVVDALLSILQRSDRLVREAGCLALGHLKAERAVAKLVDLWRNDYISTVREAAAQALKKIGGDEAKKAMHVTSVLQEEIRRLNAM